MTYQRLLPALIILATSLLACSAALAHGSEPLPENLHGFDSGEWVFHTNFGVITSDDTTRYVCEEAFSGGDNFRVAALGLHRWVIFTPDAIYRTEDGCNFEKVESLPKIPADVAAVRGGDGVAYVINTDSTEQTGVYVSEDAGASFRKVDVDVTDRQFTRAEFLGTDSLLISAYSKDSASQGAANLTRIALADDMASTLEVPEGLKYPYLLDVESDTLVWQASTDEGQSLFWGTVEAPARDEFPLDAWPNGVVLSDDGSEFWIAAANTGSKGLTHATASDMMVDIDAEHSGLCVGRAGDTVYACGRGDTEGHELSRVVDDQIEAAVHFDDIAGPRTDCPAGSNVASTCPAVWPELAQGLGVEVDQDDGSNDGGDNSGDSSDGGVCSAVGDVGPAGIHLFLLVLVGVGVARFRRDYGSAVSS